ncbi:TPA: hypothetical protein HA265_07505 [Candidatus Woesearchaeota archaeon]|nr:hypothetical protein [Candidatus Woesearchaeota archaeon]
MGWLKRFFSRKDEPEEQAPVDISIELPKLNSWVDKRLGRQFSEIVPDIESGIGKIHDLSKELKSGLKDLEHEELRNPNVTDRERQLMEGNRVSYIQQHSLFINQIPYPESLDYRNASQFCESFEQSLLRLAKSTGKSHLIMSEFFFNNAKSINRTIKQMSDTVSAMKEKMQDYDIDLEKNDRLSRSVHELQAKVKHLKELDDELSLLNQKLANSKQMRGKIEKSIEQLKESDSFAEFRKFDSEKSGHWKTVKDVEDQLYSIFTQISLPLKKFERIAFDNADLIGRYLDNPSSALASDESLTIMSILSGLRSAVQDDKLSLKDGKEKDKYLERINSMTRDSLQSFRERYVAAKHEIKVIDDRMRNIRALQELNDLNYKREHVENQVQLLQEKIDKNTRTREKIDIPSLKKEVERAVSSTFNVDVTVLESAPTGDDLKKEVEDGDDS